MIEIIPTNTCPPDFAELTKRTDFVAGFARVIQLDLGDGAFIPVVSWPLNPGQEKEYDRMAQKELSLPRVPEIQYEVHIMAEEPLELGIVLAKGGASRILGHVEGFADKREILHALAAWKEAGAAEAGLAVLLDTPFAVFDEIARQCDVVQLMSIARLGYQGAPYEPTVIDRIKALKQSHPALTIEVDGGVSEKNIEELARAGASRFGVGSSIYKAPDPKAAYEKLKSLAENAVQ